MHWLMDFNARLIFLALERHLWRSSARLITLAVGIQCETASGTRALVWRSSARLIILTVRIQCETASGARTLVWRSSADLIYAPTCSSCCPAFKITKNTFQELKTIICTFLLENSKSAD
jgi:hypothetical protein